MCRKFKNACLQMFLSTKQYRITSILFERSNAFLFGPKHHSAP